MRGFPSTTKKRPTCGGLSFFAPVVSLLVRVPLLFGLIVFISLPCNRRPAPIGCIGLKAGSMAQLPLGVGAQSNRESAPAMITFPIGLIAFPGYAGARRKRSEPPRLVRSFSPAGRRFRMCGRTPPHRARPVASQGGSARKAAGSAPRATSMRRQKGDRRKGG